MNLLTLKETSTFQVGGKFMDLFLSIFGHLISFYYMCFDRIVIHAYLTSFLNPANVVIFFRNNLGHAQITKEVLSAKTISYKNWLDLFISNNRIPCEWAQSGIRKEHYVIPFLKRFQRSGKYGVYFIFKSMERAYTYRAIKPKLPCEDPNYMMIRKHRARFTHYYFYIYDQILGPLVLRVASFFPFHCTFFINGHSFIEQRLKQEMVKFKKEDNAFLAVSNPKRLQQIADDFSPTIIRERLNYWSKFLAPRFNKQETGQLNLNRLYAISQIEFCHNFIFKRHFPIRKIFERSCDLGLLAMTADHLANIFGYRITKTINGKLHVIIDKIDQAHHVLRAYFKKAMLRQYQKTPQLLRNEVLCNDLTAFRLKKSLDQLPRIKTVCQEIIDRSAKFQAQTLNNHFNLNILAELAKPVTIRNTKVAGIKLENKRIIRLMETLLHSGSSISNWRSKELHQYLLQKFCLNPENYTLNQLRYDLRKLRAHRIIERIGVSYRYRLTDTGIKTCLIFVLFHKKIYGPIAGSLFIFKPNQSIKTNSKLEKSYRKIDRDLDQLINLIAA